MNRRDTELALGSTALRSLRLGVLLAMLSLTTAAARLEPLNDAVPALRRFGVLDDPRNPGKDKEPAEVRESAGKLCITIPRAVLLRADAVIE